MKLRFLLIVLLALTIQSCRNSSSKYIYNEGFVYGTIYHFVYESPQGKDFQEAIKEKLNEYNLMFSTFDKESIISKVNDNREVKPTPEFIACFNRALEISEITGGAFDITAGPMVNAWGFGPEDKKKMTQEKIDSLIEITGFKKIRLEDAKIVKEIPEMKLDMSAIAKGYTCDLIAEFLIKEGCKNYMVDIGGEIVAKGQNEKGKVWSIGISLPDENAFFASTDYGAIVHLPEHALATSGNYRNFYVEDGKKYAHTIDPKTGYPVQHSLLSATVLANNCMTADAYATAFMVLGLEKGIEIAGKIPEIEVYFIYSDEEGNNQIYMSDNFERHLVK
jgi:thiamine biosynthesis lipoprotein